MTGFKKVGIKLILINKNRNYESIRIKKVGEPIEKIYKRISDANSNNEFKTFIPHFIYVTDEVRLQLVENGFKVCKGSWDGVITDCLIIEW